MKVTKARVAEDHTDWLLLGDHAQQADNVGMLEAGTEHGLMAKLLTERAVVLVLHSLDCYYLGLFTRRCAIQMALVDLSKTVLTQLLHKTHCRQVDLSQLGLQMPNDTKMHTVR